MGALEGFTEHELRPGVSVFTGSLPAGSVLDAAGFQALWELHPMASPTGLMNGEPT